MESVFFVCFQTESNDHNGSQSASHSEDSWKVGFSSCEQQQLDVDAANISNSTQHHNNNTVLRQPVTSYHVEQQQQHAHAQRVGIENSDEGPFNFERPGNTQEFPCFISDQTQTKPPLEICHEQSETETTRSGSKHASSVYTYAQSDLSIITGGTESTFTTFDELNDDDDVTEHADVTADSRYAREEEERGSEYRVSDLDIFKLPHMSAGEKSTQSDAYKFTAKPDNTIPNLSGLSLADQFVTTDDVTGLSGGDFLFEEAGDTVKMMATVAGSGPVSSESGAASDFSLTSSQLDDETVLVNESVAFFAGEMTFPGGKSKSAKKTSSYNDHDSFAIALEVDESEGDENDDDTSGQFCAGNLNNLLKKSQFNFGSVRANGEDDQSSNFTDDFSFL